MTKAAPSVTMTLDQNGVTVSTEAKKQSISCVLSPTTEDMADLKFPSNPSWGGLLHQRLNRSAYVDCITIYHPNNVCEDLTLSGLVPLPHIRYLRRRTWEIYLWCPSKETVTLYLKILRDSGSGEPSTSARHGPSCKSQRHLSNPQSETHGRDILCIKTLCLATKPDLCNVNIQIPLLPQSGKIQEKWQKSLPSSQL